MAQCKFCDSETQLFDNGIPICLECAAALEKPKKKPPAPAAESESQQDKSARAS
jgi:hypothetical protein